MSKMQTLYTAKSASGYLPLPTSTGSSSFGAFAWAVSTKAGVISLALYQPLPMTTFNPADHQRVPSYAQGAYMRDSDSLPVADRPNAVTPILPARSSEPVANIQDVNSGQAADVGTTQASRMELLQRRMPPREKIQAIIDRAKGKRRPWLDDRYDLEPKD
jgi:hypothetical protein